MSLPEPALDAESLFNLAVAQRLDLRALQAGYAAQEAAVHKAVLDQFPNLALTITGTRDSSDNRLLGPAVNFTLPLWNRNRGGIAVAEATRAALKAEYEARIFQTRAEISAAVSGLEVARKQRTDLSGGLPELERFAAAARRAADQGDLALATAETPNRRARQTARARAARSGGFRATDRAGTIDGPADGKLEMNRVMLLLLLLALLMSCSDGPSSDATSEPAALVTLATATPGDLAETVTVYGAASAGAASEQALSAPVESTIATIDAPTGTHVQSGQPIVTLQPSPTAALELIRATNDAAQAEAAYARAQRLRGDGLMSDATERPRGGGECGCTRASLARRSDALTIRAPASGTVR